MNVPLDEVIYFDAITTHPTTGAAADADSTPTFEVFEEATDTDIGVGGNLTKRTSKTGNYRGSFTLSSANGFEVGKWYSIIGSATVNSVAGKAVLKNFRVVAAEAIAGKPKADVDGWLGTACATPSVAGVPEVDVTHIGGDAQSATDLKDFADAGYDPSTNKVQGVVLTDTLTTYTGNTPQTGDSYAIVNHGTNGNAAIKTQVAAIEADTQDIQSRIPAALVNSRMDCTIDGTGMETGAVDNILNRDASGSTTNSTLGAIINDWENGGRLDLIIDNVNTLVAGNDTYLSGLNSRIPAALTADGNMKADALRINGQLTSAAATVTFPATIASTTNITAGTITTVTNLTNAPTSGDLTSTMKDSVETAVTTALGGTDVTDFTAIPSGTPNVLEALGFLYAQGFYRKEQTATTTTLYDGDNNAVAEATTSDNGTTFVRTRFSAP